MATPSFGLAGNNGAPMPPPGNTNPTGTNNGVSLSGNTFPNYQAQASSPNSGIIPLSSNAPLFGATDFAGMSSGFDNGTNWQSLADSLGKAYGKGPGQTIYNILSQGLFNPETAAAFLNAMQPSINQGTASVENAFGAEGSRFGSAAALGISNFQGQANLNEQQTLASMYENAQQEQLQLLEGVLPTLHSEQANKGSWEDDLVGGLEIAGGIAAAPFTGGLSLGIAGAGASELNKGISGGGGGATGGFNMNPYSIPMGGNTGTFGASAPSLGPSYGTPNYAATIQSASAGQLYGGVDDFGDTTDSGSLPFLQ